MTRPSAGLPVWLLAELDPSLRLATALTGDPDTAATLVAEALARDSCWTELTAGTDPTPTLRTMIIADVLVQQRTRPAAGRTDLDRLQPLTRAAVVLRDGDHLTLAEIATTLDRPIKQVAADLAAIPPGSHAQAVHQLRSVAPDPSQVGVRYAAAAHRVRQSRHRRRAWLAAGTGAAVVVSALLVALPSIVLRLDPPEVRAAGEWRFTHVVEPVDGLMLTERMVTDRLELTVLTWSAAADEHAQCFVGLGSAPWDQGPAATDRTGSRSVRVGPWWATSVDRPEDDPSVTWQYAPERYARVTCTGDGIPVGTVLTVARAVRFEDSRVKVPFTFDSLPEGYRIQAVDEAWADGAKSVSVGLQPVDGGSVPSVDVRFGSRKAADRCLEDPSSSPGGSAQPGPHDRAGAICATTWWSTEDAPDAPGRSRRAVDDIIKHLVPATALPDRSTWFDAADLPR